ncbi:hypothetical protein pmac_cds_675 [Pandoravirus macleodensis]|uniref:Uncharacterized protein n=1 Tax=Pandoravirus macleodensis TaxID=2107707 RepID=A0A2U7UFV0_9VIRU|nr:hypothetical protein pmac_cds_675 [Pandoravirus macleodensis]AVK77363.1 hypothetical protein pmac_cds_675 [Pandoravirus macleodensis]
MRAFGKSNDDERDGGAHNDDRTRNKSKRDNNSHNDKDKKPDGQAFEPAVKTAVVDLIARHRRQVTGNAVIDQVRRQGHGDAAKWMRDLGDHQLAAFLSRLSCVHRAIVVEGHAGDNVFIVPATLVRRPMSAKRARREWGQAPHWVARAWTLVSTPQQCRRAVADLRQRPFVSVVVDASHRHDLGLVHIAALGDDGCLPRCYTFDVCATPEMEWCGAGDLFDAGDLADLLGDAQLPKAVCGFGCGHSRIAHLQSEALMRTPVEIATQTPTGFTGVMMRGVVNVLPLTDGRVSGAVAIALRGRDLDIDAWQRAGAAIVHDKLQWQRRPLPMALWADAAQRAFSLCVAYEALCDIAGSIDPARALVAQRASDGLLCFAAAQTLAQTTWKSVGSSCDGGADNSRAPESADDWDELERAVRSYVDTQRLTTAHSLEIESHADRRGFGEREPNDNSASHGDDGHANGRHAAAQERNADDEDDEDDWYGDGQGACADASSDLYEPPIGVWMYHSVKTT